MIAAATTVVLPISSVAIGVGVFLTGQALNGLSTRRRSTQPISASQSDSQSERQAQEQTEEITGAEPPDTAQSSAPSVTERRNGGRGLDRQTV